ncbi:hypothetical protein HDIA_2401 [Hartmannibacter diazotrophicus]|uniref:Uncharacterized protein n=1 Tax=Hartmannibacter diazotrophicus TaxID=1482074 RepID=A0A2C9D6J4_9HYPH|nr:hypothetical protein [Hartmannibacter diazotrophicus]SON55942.1 hypothetical protein HDIA_2401 [Hartmannibacter diazotrophicus]
MWDFRIVKTLEILFRTLPFILLRMAIYFGITIAMIAATGTGAGIGYGVGHVGKDPEVWSFWGGAIGFGAVWGIAYWLREYILYTVKAGHIAVMVELIDGKTIPGGKSQIAYAQDVVKARFAEVNILFVLDQLIKAAVRAVTGLIWGIALVLPIPALGTVAKFANSVVRISLTYVDEIILGYNIRLRSRNPWETSRQGLVLYAQNGKVMVKNALWLTVFLYILAFIVFVVMLGPAATLFYFLPDAVGGWSFVAAIVFAWAIKAALLEPFAIAALMDVYFRTIEGQQPNQALDDKLASVSAKFRELKEMAMRTSGPVAR